MKLSELKQEQIAILKGIHMSKENQHRLMYLGFYIGMPIQTIRNAPMHDPTIYSICGNDIILRKSDAENIVVEVVL